MLIHFHADIKFKVILSNTNNLKEFTSIPLHGCLYRWQFFWFLWTVERGDTSEYEPRCRSLIIMTQIADKISYPILTLLRPIIMTQIADKISYPILTLLRPIIMTQIADKISYPILTLLRPIRADGDPATQLTPPLGNLVNFPMVNSTASNISW